MPRMIDLIRSSAVSATIMQAAARGALLLPPEETIEILVHLANHNKVFGQQARMTLAGWDEKASRTAAANPNTAKDVLEYWITPHNLRPALFPLLLENPAVSEESLTGLASSATREIGENMLKSDRVRRAPKIMAALASNPNMAGLDCTVADEQQPELDATPLAAEETHSSQLQAPPLYPAPDGPTTAQEPTDADVMAFLTEHASELASQGEQPFQPIGGFYEEFVPSGEAPPVPETAPETATVATSPTVAGTASASAAAAPAKKPTVSRKVHLSHEEERGSALQKISRLDVKGRIQLAMKGTKEERSILIRDGTKLVALAVLESPKITDGEVEKIASQKNVLEAVLRQIPMKRRFAKNYAVLRNLVFNPRTPLDVSLGLMKHLLVNDLRNLGANKEVSETVRKLGLKMFKQKTDTSKKSSG